MKVVPDKECKMFSKFDEHNICAKSATNGTLCNGDSGGPLIYYEDGEPTIIGVVSYGYDTCYNTDPSVFMFVKNYMNWISKLIL